MSLTEKAKEFDKLLNWEAFVKMAQVDMKFDDKPDVVRECVGVFTHEFHLPNPGLPDIRMVSQKVCPDLFFPTVDGVALPNIEAMSLMNRMLELLKVLKQVEMAGKYLVEADAATQPAVPRTAPKDLDNALVNELEMAVLKASGGKQSMEMQARIRHFTKSCVGPDGDHFWPGPDPEGCEDAWGSGLQSCLSCALSMPATEVCVDPGMGGKEDSGLHGWETMAYLCGPD
jgi:hypothetical protein